MEVMISVCGETPTIGEVFHCGDAYATVVSVDTSGNPVELPFELAPDSPADKSRCAGAPDRSALARISPYDMMTAELRLVAAAMGGTTRWEGACLCASLPNTKPAIASSGKACCS